MTTTKLVKTLITAALTVCALFFAGELVKNVDTTQMSSFSRAMIDILPLVQAIASVVTFAAVCFGGVTVARYLKWQAFGNRLKVAYIAKFGYDNPAFDEEVDNHIRTMRSLSKDSEFTRKAAEDWLKRMAHMVEVQYAIPEEEHLSETEKTKLFEDWKLKDEKSTPIILHEEDSEEDTQVDGE